MSFQVSGNQPIDPVNQNDGFIDYLSGDFDTGSTSLWNDLKTAEVALSKDPSNPSVLANFQAKLQEYTLYRNAQSNTVKVAKDIGSAIIQNFR
ncbi:type III secretion system needle filament subunit SctF [Enterobacter sp. 22466]|uniref:type III secretion system needle filament subunit SctF n=1 Tax=Enterobacter sp. 22466 TaxID=3453924 RepID=UPI003F83A276